MNEHLVPVPARFREKTWLGFAISSCIFLEFIVTAHLIGHKYSCTPIANVYYWGGFLSLPILFAMPLVFAPRLHVVKRACIGFLNVGLGIVIWAWAYDTAGMYFMCRLF